MGKSHAKVRDNPLKNYKGNLSWEFYNTLSCFYEMLNLYYVEHITC